MNDSAKIGHTKLSFWLGGFFFLAFACMLFLQATKQIYDPDFWWHLKAGQTMVQEGGLLESDPFTFHDNSAHATREKIILKGYWLWQVTAYTLYDLFGLSGIFLLKLLSMTAIATALVLQFYRQRVGPFLAAPLLLAGFLLLGEYPMERPQIFSFLFAILLIGMLMAVRRGGRLGPALPFVMCLWANVHGGFVVGVLILICFASGVIIEYRHDRPKMKNLLAWAVAGMVAALVNPNGALVFLELANFQNSALMNTIGEYQSTWAVFGQGQHLYALLWLLIVVYFAALFVLRRVFWPEFLIAVFLAYFSARYTRNVPFFTLAMLPAIGCAWREVGQRWRWPGLQWVGMITTSAVILMTLWFVQADWKSWQPHVKVKAIYPEKVIGFLERSGLQGRMFNSYEYGGYLLWRLAPQVRVFIDGRGLNPPVFDDYSKISNANVDPINARNDYLTLLNTYQIDYVLQPIYDGSGHVQPLMKALLDRPEWQPIYLDTQVYILAKKVAQNEGVIEAHKIAKSEFQKRLLVIYNYLHRNDPQEIGFRIARAEMFIYLGYYEDARNEVDAISSMAPEHLALPVLLQALQVLEWRRARSLDLRE